MERTEGRDDKKDGMIRRTERYGRNGGKAGRTHRPRTESSRSPTGAAASHSLIRATLFSESFSHPSHSLIRVILAACRSGGGFSLPFAGGERDGEKGKPSARGAGSGRASDRGRERREVIERERESEGSEIGEGESRRARCRSGYREWTRRQGARERE